MTASTTTRTFFREIRSSIESLWVAGILALVIMLYLTYVGFNTETREWGLYLLLGSLYPILILSFLGIARYRNSAEFTLTYRFMLGIGAITGLILAASSCHLSSGVVAAALSLLAMAAYAFFRYLAGGEIRIDSARIFPMVLVSLLSWLGALGCIYWTPPLQWLSSSYSLSVLVFSIFVSAAAFSGWRGERRCAYSRAAGHLLASVVFAALSLRTDILFTDVAYHHWGFWVGPAEFVREGGWLLWDTPSQYGFLSMLALAAMPMQSVWNALFALQAVLLFLIAIMLYFQLRQWGGGFLNYLFSLLTSATSVYFMSGCPFDLSGEQQYPSVGAMRFIWCYALMFLLWFCLGRKPSRLPLFRWFGALVWVCGVLWSIESAIYSTAIYGIASMTIALQTAYRSRGRNDLPHQRLVLFAQTLRVLLFAPAVTLAAALGVIYLVYLVRLGHAPDWRAYCEYALLYKGGFGALPIDSDGPVWVLITVFCILTSIAAAFLAEKPDHPNLGIVLGAWGVVWAVSSYFVVRSHANNVDNVMPILIMALAISLPALEHLEETRAHLLFRHAGIPVFAICMAAILGNPLLLQGSPRLWDDCTNVEERLPFFHAPLDELISTGQVDGGDSLIMDYKSEFLPPRIRLASPQGPQALFLPAWLPKPLVMFRLLPEERRVLYLSRWFERRHPSGWFIANAKNKNDSWLLSALIETHTLEERAKAGPYTLYRCDWIVKNLEEPSSRR